MSHLMVVMTLMGVDTVRYVSKVFADDVSWDRHARSALEMILFHSAK